MNWGLQCFFPFIKDKYSNETIPGSIIYITRPIIMQGGKTMHLHSAFYGISVLRHQKSEPVNWAPPDTAPCFSFSVELKLNVTDSAMLGNLGFTFVNDSSPLVKRVL